jgi:hypothetical protein
MRHIRLLFFLTIVLIGAAAAQEQSKPSAPPALTIYNANFAVVRERLPLDLHAGVNTLTYTGITAHLEPDSVILRDPTGQHALQVLEQNYRNDPVSQELLLSLYEGKTIEFQVQPGQIVKGKIIRSGYMPRLQYDLNGQNYAQSTQPLIEVDGQLRFGLPGQPLFPALIGDTVLNPTLAWQLNTNTPGSFEGEISYVTGGLSWQSDYNLVVASAPKGGGDLLDLIGWVTMRNQSGKTFENARIKLMAGDVSKLQPAGVGYGGALKAMAANLEARDAMAPTVSEKAFDEFHLYTLARPATLHDQETKQVEFVRATAIHSQRVYVYDGAKIDSRYSYMNADQIRQDHEYGTQSNPKVWVMQEFKNAEANHLGIPLPKGRLRFYRRDTDGHLEFIGENMIDHTPKDETVRVYTGNAFDIVGERRRTSIRTEFSRLWMEESFEIKVRNHKKEPVNVRVVEHLYRWSTWNIVDKSADFTKKDAQTIEFPVTIAPDGEQTITYTVHYSW